MIRRPLNRRQFIAAAAAKLAAAAVSTRPVIAASRPLRLATFQADVTVPLGHPLMGGGIAAASEIGDPLGAHGFVLLGAGRPVVFVAVEWCEIRNEAYARWRRVLADAAGTQPERVLVSSTHAHDAPVADVGAQRWLDHFQTGVKITDVAFHERAVQRVAAALRSALNASQTVTHLGIGEARVEAVASNRRVIRPDGVVDYGRGSASGGNALYRDAPEGTVDPFLKTISFWNASRPLAALHSYATHPMSKYGLGRVSGDFVGAARRRRQEDDPQVFQIYASGCSGNVTAGKYNDGTPPNRERLAARIHEAMRKAWAATQRLPLTHLRFHSEPLQLDPRNSPGFTVEEMKRRLADPSGAPFLAFAKCKAAMGLSWRERVEAGHRLDIPVLDFGPAHLILLPAESYVEFQLFAQAVRPEGFVMAVGYGECAPGYIPIEKAWAENDSNLRDWCWVAPGAETAMKAAITAALKPTRAG
jgi:hypothetical protein